MDKLQDLEKLGRQKKESRTTDPSRENSKDLESAVEETQQEIRKAFRKLNKVKLARFRASGPRK